MTLDLSKPIQTRDGRPVRILCTDRTGEYPVVGLVPARDPNAPDMLYTWTTDGQYYDVTVAPPHDLDLVNVPGAEPLPPPSDDLVKFKEELGEWKLGISIRLLNLSQELDALKQRMHDAAGALSAYGDDE